MIKGFTKAEAQNCLDRCGDDEPVFLLRAQDVNFCPTVAAWGMLTIIAADKELNTTGAEKAQDRLEGLHHVTNWQAVNHTKVAD